MTKVQRQYPGLAEWRSAARLTQREAAKILQLSQAKYSRLERRAMFARGPLAKRLAEKTGVPILDLLGVAS
jgi:transcriptional regulator with XRE-family HTH domain